LLRIIGRRLPALILVESGVLTLVFLIMHLLPGDPARMILEGAAGGAVGGGAPTEEMVQQLREQLGLNDPIAVQYGRFLYNAIQGDFGKSFRQGRPVTKVILEQWPATLQLALAALFLAVVIGIVLGVIAALRQGSWADTLCIVTSVVGVSMPSFWLGLLLILFFCVRIPLFPVVRGTGLRGLVLPAIALGAGDIAGMARLVRSSMLEVLRAEYITTARGKGLTERAVIYRHALRNALIPAVTFAGLRFGRLLGGTVIIETVFARQGVGYILKEAVLGRDYPLIQGAVLFIALFYGFANLVVDLLYIILDPRIREV